MNYCVKHNELCDSANASGHCSLTACNRYLLITDEAPTKEYILSEYDTPFTALENVIGELIRCKDCKYFENYKNGGHLGWCHNKGYGDGWGNYPPPIKSEDGYCDWVERKEE